MRKMPDGGGRCQADEEDAMQRRKIRLRRFVSSLRYHYDLVGFGFHLLCHFQNSFSFFDWTIFGCGPTFLAKRTDKVDFWGNKVITVLLRTNTVITGTCMIVYGTNIVIVGKLSTY